MNKLKFLGWRLREKYYTVKTYLTNIVRYRKELADAYPWDYSTSLSFLKRSLELSADFIENRGDEIEGPRMKKVAMMRRAIEILGNINDYKYHELAEASLKKELVHKEISFVPTDETKQYYTLVDNLTEMESTNNIAIYDEARRIEKEEWKELFRILEGQDEDMLRELAKTQDYHEVCDGSGLQRWWT